ncbi:MAG: hypothetical protein ACREUF_13085, partial [Solimonas sp.]
MTGVVSSTVTRTQASSTSPQGNTGGLASNGQAKGDRFRDLLSKLTGVTGSDVKAAGTVPQGEAQPDPSRSAAAWKLQLGIARGGAAGESASGNDPAMAQPPVMQNTARAQDAATAQQLAANGEESSDNIASNPLLAELLGAAEATDEL